MKFLLAIFGAAVATTTAFCSQPVSFARPTSTSLSITKEEDLELTRKVIQDFQAEQSGEPRPAPAPKKEEKKEEAKEE
jgi:ABC-type glycerol-3-phosphate transport system substrate-binding protein